MKRLTAMIAATALVAGVAGGAIDAYAFQRDSDAAAVEPIAEPAPAATPTTTTTNRSPGAMTAEQIYKADAPGVVVITDTQTQQLPATFFGGPSSQQVRVLGSGFVLDTKGDIVTNDHVVNGATAVRVGFTGGATYPARVLGTDPSTDLALIRVDAPASALHPLMLAPGAAQVGDTVYAIGNPFGLDRTMTAGIVSAVGRAIQAPNGLAIENAIQTDAAVNHGNSGGPLIDQSGRVIGVNSQIETGGTSQGNVGVGFAVPSATVRTVVDQLLTTGHVEHAFLGVEVEGIDPVLASTVKGIPAHGVLVTRVFPGGPAARAGIVAGSRQVVVQGETAVIGGDAIVSTDGKPVDSPDALAALIAQHRSGDRVVLGVVRGGSTRSVTVTLGVAPSGR
jgi:S1-C subfamily serine protease